MRNLYQENIMAENKKFFRYILLVCMTIVLVMSGSWKPVKAKVELSKTYVVLLLGREGKDTYQIRVSKMAEGDKIAFSSKDQSVAVVDGGGKIMAVAPGKTTVTCTITAAGGEKTKKTVTVRVYDNIKSLTLGVGDVRRNALHKNVSYALTYTCKTVAGTNKNIGNYIYYEVCTPEGKMTENASIDADGKFSAKSYGTYLVLAYAFQSSSQYKKWVGDREKYAGNVLAKSTLTLMVVPASYSVKEQKIGKFTVTLPSKYEVGTVGKSKDRTTCSVHVKKQDGQNAVSNIQVIIDGVDEAQSYEVFSSVMASVYTKGALEQSWKSAYNAGKATVKNLKTQKLTVGDKEILKISYGLILRNIVLGMRKEDDLKISRMEFFNTVYTWYDGKYHISVTVTDAMEELRPNISEAAEKMVKKFTVSE